MIHHVAKQAAKAVSELIEAAPAYTAVVAYTIRSVKAKIRRRRDRSRQSRNSSPLLH